MGQTDVACYSDTWTTNQVANAVETKLAREAENIEEADNSPSVSDSIEERLSDFNSMSSSGYLISDVIIFKYCLGGMTDRALLLKEVATSASEEDLFRLANEVSLYSGCSHHRRQIVIAKRLIEEGTKVWNSISQNNRLIQWENGVFEIEEQFMRITCSSTRSFTEQDFGLLRRISGCGEYMAQENFEKIWRWLYPVAFTLTSDSINTIWNSTSPKVLGSSRAWNICTALPTSRSWPHSDAGCLIVTYVGSDYTIHHRLLSLDYIYSSCEESEMNGKSLEDMLIVRQRQ
uniref:Uncharacterized protein n=2 Tax=Salix viminalis TaxID=40686 RepID=A0A6N2LWX0_SALVM